MRFFVEGVEKKKIRKFQKKSDIWKLELMVKLCYVHFISVIKKKTLIIKKWNYEKDSAKDTEKEWLER